MSISLNRNGKWIELEFFSNQKVEEYLDNQLNQLNPNTYEKIAKTVCGNVELYRYLDVYFMLHTDKTRIEISFNSKDKEKMTYLINTITRWERFSKEKTVFYAEIEDLDDSSYLVIFENGYMTIGEYKRFFGEKLIKIVKF